VRPSILATVGIVAILAGAAGWLFWDKFYRELPQPATITGSADSTFLYGSAGTSAGSSLPYWLVVVLPRVFGEDHLPGAGGYAALLPWEEGQELPVGFSKQTSGVERVAFNCALCHTSEHRLAEHDTPRIAAAGRLHAADIKGLAAFFTGAANDARFDADTILTEIDLAWRLSRVDRLLYRYVFIPAARQRLIDIARQLTSPHASSASGVSHAAPFPASGRLAN